MPEADDRPGFTIPPELIERWMAIPEHTTIEFQVTRLDLDNLLLAIRESIVAQSFALSAVGHAAMSDLEATRSSLEKAGQHLDAAFIRINVFTSRVMTSVSGAEVEHGK